MTLRVDHDALDGISRRLASAGTDLDKLSANTPTAVDGGDGSPAILGILARLTDNAGQLVVALSAAGTAVSEANADYRAQDVETADRLNVTVWTEA